MSKIFQALPSAGKLLPMALLASLVVTLAPAPLRAQRLTVIPSDQANKSSYVTNKGINWYTSLPDAQVQAAKEGKLVFWMHMLGTMDGGT